MHALSSGLLALVESGAPHVPVSPSAKGLEQAASSLGPHFGIRVGLFPNAGQARADLVSVLCSNRVSAASWHVCVCVWPVSKYVSAALSFHFTRVSLAKCPN